MPYHIVNTFKIQTHIHLFSNMFTIIPTSIRLCWENLISDFVGFVIPPIDFWGYYLHRFVCLTFLQGYLSYIKTLPINDAPEIFGLHDNANITFAQNETFALLDALLLLQPKTGAGGGQSREEVSDTIIVKNSSFKLACAWYVQYHHFYQLLFLSKL